MSKVELRLCEYGGKPRTLLHYNPLSAILDLTESGFSKVLLYAVSRCTYEQTATFQDNREMFG